MKIKFLGTGTSLGVPIIGCDCSICQSTDSRDKRTRSSIIIEEQGKHIVIDTGPDFRSQCLANNVRHIDAVLITHPHRDHLAGLDDIRPFCYIQKQYIPIYASELSCKAIRRDFGYCFAEPKYPGVPDIELHQIEYGQAFQIADITVMPIAVMHAKMEVTAYRIGRFTYITDASLISPESIDLIRGSEYLVVNALRQEAHPSHFNLPQALELIGEINPRQAFITHIGHTLAHQATETLLPDNVRMAYDGMTAEF
ncbi:MAG: MBL fold metallo-hydrolase [Bacteroidales bacterium]|nr:MBL fold metallo-hydrolase [Bacteroidales bacterium]